MSEENILTDPNSPGWRYLRDTEQIQPGDEFLNSECMWCLTNRVGEIADRQVTYRRRIEPVPRDSVSKMPIEQVRSELQSRGIDTTAATARVLAAVHAATQSQPQATNIDDPSGDGWRWVRRGEALSDGDVEKINGGWRPTIEAGYTCPRNHCYRRRIEPQQPQATEPDDPSGPGWRWVEVGEWVEPTDMWEYLPGKWRGNASLGALCVTANYYRRRIEQPQPSDSDNVAELTVKQPAPPLPDRQPDSRPTSPPPPRKRADTDAPEWRIETLQNMLNATCETLSRRVQDLQRENAELQAAVAQLQTSLQATVTLEPEWAADIDKFFVSRDAGLQHILRWYYRRAAERKAEQ